MYYYNNDLPPQQGWICPKCGRVNAPWMPTCGCVSSQTTGTAIDNFPQISITEDRDTQMLDAWLLVKSETKE